MNNSINPTTASTESHELSATLPNVGSPPEDRPQNSLHQMSGNPGERSLSELIAERRRELEELLRKQREEGDEDTKQKRAMVEEFIKKLGAANLQEAIVIMRNLFSPPKGRRMTANTKAQIDLAIKNGATAADIRRHFGLSHAAYYLRKKKLGLTKPVPRKVPTPVFPTRPFRNRRRDRV
jgi:hypothetical protein